MQQNLSKTTPTFWLKKKSAYVWDFKQFKLDIATMGIFV
jgi:hypothetical protein